MITGVRDVCFSSGSSFIIISAPRPPGPSVCQFCEPGDEATYGQALLTKHGSGAGGCNAGLLRERYYLSLFPGEVKSFAPRLPAGSGRTRIRPEASHCGEHGCCPSSDRARCLGVRGHTQAWLWWLMFICKTQGRRSAREALMAGQPASLLPLRPQGPPCYRRQTVCHAAEVP